MTSVVYLGDGNVGEAVIYGLPFIVGEPVDLPEGFEFAGKILANPTFAVIAADKADLEVNVATVELRTVDYEASLRPAASIVDGALTISASAPLVVPPTVAVKVGTATPVTQEAPKRRGRPPRAR